MRLFLSAAILAGLAASAAGPGSRFVVSTDIGLPDGCMLYLDYRLDGHSVTDSAAMKEGKACFYGTIDKIQPAFLTFQNPDEKKNRRSLMFYLEPSEINITIGDTRNVYSATSITGSHTQKEADWLKAKTDSVDKQLSEIFMKIREEKAPASGLQKSKIDSLHRVKRSLMADFIRRHPASRHSLTILDYDGQYFSPETRLELFNVLADNLRAEKPELEKRFRAEINVKPGKQAPEITGTDPVSNNEIRLSNLRGKLVLIEFWASSCGHCRAAMPHISNLFEKYHDCGLEVLLVSCDSNADVWKKYITGHGLDRMLNVHEYSSVSLNGDGNVTPDENDIRQTDSYGVVGIPAIFLIDQNGRIVGQFFEPDRLEAAIKKRI